MLKELIKLANHLDNKGLQKEADYLDAVIRKYSDLSNEEEYAIIHGELMKFLKKQKTPPEKKTKKK